MKRDQLTALFEKKRDAFDEAARLSVLENASPEGSLEFYRAMKVYSAAKSAYEIAVNEFLKSEAP